MAAWSVDDMVRIVSFGEGLDVSAARLSVDDAVKIASFAAPKGARVTFRDTDRWSANDAVKIGNFGKGMVTFVR